jgi:plasmid stabilization system protein ParE
MTTNAEPTQAQTELSTSDYGELWRAIGRLEGTAAALLEGQRELRSDLDLGLREVNRRIDRLFYTILAFGGAIIVAVFASRFVGS